MKRVYTVLSLILVLVALALPAFARADDDGAPAFAPAGWSWDESAPTATPEGWTWDEV